MNSTSCSPVKAPARSYGRVSRRLPPVHAGRLPPVSRLLCPLSALQAVSSVLVPGKTDRVPHLSSRRRLSCFTGRIKIAQAVLVSRFHVEKPASRDESGVGRLPGRGQDRSRGDTVDCRRQNGVKSSSRANQPGLQSQPAAPVWLVYTQTGYTRTSRHHEAGHQ